MINKDEKVVRNVTLKQLSISMQACDYLFQRLLKDRETEKIKFTDNREAYLRPFAEPHFDKKGHPVCAIDLVMPDGHLEFEISLSGYGGTPKEFAHKGDPCQYCGVSYKNVAPGPCPAMVNKRGEEES